jgi:putative transposase
VYDTVSKPRWLKRRLSDIVELQREISPLEEAAKKASGKTKGFPVGGQLKAAYARLSSVHQKVRNQRDDLYHKLSAWLVSRFGHIITEELSVASIQTDDRKSSGLSCGVADDGWAGFLQMLRSKAEEAGAKYEEVPTRQVKPTRRCSGCGELNRREDIPLHQRMYACAA